MAIVWLLLIGLVAGALARLIVPGDDSMGIVPTIILGVVGAFVGGLIGWLFNRSESFTTPSPWSLILATVGAILALLVYKQVRARA